MNISFDTFQRFETPQLILCNPSSRFEDNALTTAIGELVNVSDISFEFDFGSYSELNFRINNVRHEDSIKNRTLRSMFDGVMNRRQIFVPVQGGRNTGTVRFQKVGEFLHRMAYTLETSGPIDGIQVVFVVHCKCVFVGDIKRNV